MATTIVFAYSTLNNNFRGVQMKLKILALEISVEKLIFLNFLQRFTVKLQAYKLCLGKQALCHGLKC